MGQLENLMKLGLTETEAKQVLEDDKKIDRGEKMPFDLSADKVKETRKYRQTDRAPTVYNWQNKRERKPNDEKRLLIDVIRYCLEDSGVNEIEITNAERQIDFIFNDTRYRIVLSAPRK